MGKVFFFNNSKQNKKDQKTQNALQREPTIKIWKEPLALDIEIKNCDAGGGGGRNASVTTVLCFAVAQIRVST